MDKAEKVLIAMAGLWVIVFTNDDDDNIPNRPIGSRWLCQIRGKCATFRTAKDALGGVKDWSSGFYKGYAVHPTLLSQDELDAWVKKPLPIDFPLGERYEKKSGRS